MSKNVTKPELTLGPILFHWPEDKWRDFYYKIADEAPIDTVFIGETVCAKRAVFTEPYYDDVAQRLTRAGKKVVFSTLGEVTVKLDRRCVESVCSLENVLIEANDASSLWALTGKPHAVGPLVNTYNNETLSYLAKNGAIRFSLPPEIPRDSIARLCHAGGKKKPLIEVQVYGRVPLALSARCYHARAHGYTKDSCQFVCGKDPDGMALHTLSGKPFLCINGVETMSYTCLNLLQEIPDLIKIGVGSLRLSPHDHDMTMVAQIFDNVITGKEEAASAIGKLSKISGFLFSNGFYHKKEGFRWVLSGKKAA